MHFGPHRLGQATRTRPRPRCRIAPVSNECSNIVRRRCRFWLHCRRSRSPCCIARRPRPIGFWSRIRRWSPACARIKHLAHSLELRIGRQSRRCSCHRSWSALRSRHRTSGAHLGQHAIGPCRRTRCWSTAWQRLLRWRDGHRIVRTHDLDVVVSPKTSRRAQRMGVELSGTDHRTDTLRAAHSTTEAKAGAPNRPNRHVAHPERMGRHRRRDATLKASSE